MSSFEAKFTVPFSFPVHFTRGVFSPANPVLNEVIPRSEEPTRILAVFEKAVATAMPSLPGDAAALCSSFAETIDIHVVEGGEPIKNRVGFIGEMHRAIDGAKLSRHSYVFAVGGGALLDAVGFAAATAHRGVRLIRFPTTTLSQADGGVGVKNAINFEGKKNFAGAFAPPFAVINDFDFIESLSPRDLRAGTIEALKVAVIKDREFFEWIQANVLRLSSLHRPTLHSLIERCAVIHLKHICSGGDPFESGSSRPLDFGHWAAHKLEQLSQFRLRHGEAVAIGMALDTLYSAEIGLCSASDAESVHALIRYLGFETSAPELADTAALLKGIEEFREHLGGRLTVTMLNGIGTAQDIHEIDLPAMKRCLEKLRNHA